MKTVQIVLKPQIKHGFAKGLCNQSCLGYRSCKSAKSATLTRLQLSVWLKRLRNFEQDQFPRSRLLCRHLNSSAHKFWQKTGFGLFYSGGRTEAIYQDGATAVLTRLIHKVAGLHFMAN